MTIRLIFNHYVDGRLSEWAMAAAMLGIALLIMAWPAAIGAAEFHLLARIVDGTGLAVLFLVVAVARVVALVVNGRSCVYGPRARAIGAAAGALIWAQMDCALVILLIDLKVPSPGVPVYFALTLCELLTSYRAATDVRFRPRA